VTLQEADIKGLATPLTVNGYYGVWKGLLAGAFPPVHLGVTKSNPRPVSAPDYICVDVDDNAQTPFSGISDNAWASIFGSSRGEEAYALAHSYVTWFGTYTAQPPPNGILSQIFKPVTNLSQRPPPPPVNNGTVTPLGIDKDLFFSSVISESEADKSVLELGNPLDEDCPTHIPSPPGGG
jgi:hypothetical protein